MNKMKVPFSHCDLWENVRGNNINHRALTSDVNNHMVTCTLTILWIILYVLLFVCFMKPALWKKSLCSNNNFIIVHIYTVFSDFPVVCQCISSLLVLCVHSELPETRVMFLVCINMIPTIVFCLCITSTRPEYVHENPAKSKFALFGFK